jgi:SOS-response transcriptional repressor LexA
MPPTYKCVIAHPSRVQHPDCRAGLWLCESTPMAAEVFDINVVRAELDRLMKKHKIKRKPLAKAAGLGETAIRDIYDDRRSDVRASTLVKLADYFSVPIDVLAGREPVSLVGAIGAGGSIIYEETNDADTVPRPPVGTGPMVALRVQGESMLPKYESGDIIYIQRDPLIGVMPEYVGKYCAVRLTDGATFLKILAHGTEPGRYTLRSLNAADMENVEVEWATPVRFVLPKDSLET